MSSEELLPEFIATFVPLEIMRLEQHGGPKPTELAEAATWWLDVVDRGGGAELLYLERGKTAHSAGMLIRTIACLAFEAGGIKVFGNHFVAYEKA